MSVNFLVKLFTETNKDTDEMDGACSTLGREEISIENFSRKT
jgi:hypothetical protein